MLCRDVSLSHGKYAGKDIHVPQCSLAVLGAVDSIDTLLRVFFSSECYVDAHRLLVLSVLLGLAYDDLEDLAVLPKVVVTAEGLEQFVFAYGGRETGNVYEVLLDDTQPR